MYPSYNNLFAHCFSHIGHVSIEIQLTKFIVCAISLFVQDMSSVPRDVMTHDVDESQTPLCDKDL
jgi:hypothetical protein